MGAAGSPEARARRSSWAARGVSVLVCSASLGLAAPGRTSTSQLLSTFGQCSRAATEKDNYYRKAKALGFRARSAFKVSARAHTHARTHAHTHTRAFDQTAPPHPAPLEHSCCSLTTSLAS